MDHEEVAHGDQARDGHHGEAQPETKKMGSGELSAAECYDGVLEPKSNYSRGSP